MRIDAAVTGQQRDRGPGFSQSLERGGKALLAFLPRPDLDRLLNSIDLIQRGPRTLTDKKALLADLEQVRRTGIATYDEELDSALRSIAAPVRAHSGEVVAPVNVAIPWSPAPMRELVTRLGPTVKARAGQPPRWTTVDPPSAHGNR